MLLDSKRERAQESFERRFSEAPASLVRPPLIVLHEPRVEIVLQFLHAQIQLLAESHPVKLVEHRAMEALADAIRLRALHLRSRVLDVLHCQVQLVRVVLGVPAILRASIGEEATQRNALLVDEGHHAVVGVFSVYSFANTTLL